MAAPFVPLFPTDQNAISAHQATRVRAAGQAFAPVLARVEATSARVSPSAPSPSSCAPPTISVERDGDTVKQIRVRCGCGEVIELECDYTHSQ